MIRRAFTMRLKPDASSEYQRQHDNIWPELVAEIERSGIASITTFRRDLDLFLVSEITNEEAWDNLWNSEIHRRWAEVMQPLMHLRDDGIVDAGELSEVFHLSTSNGHHEPASAAAGSVDELIAEAVANIDMALDQLEAAPAAKAARKAKKSKAKPAKASPRAKASKGSKKMPAKKKAKAAPAKAAKKSVKKKPAKKAVKKAAKKAAPKKAKKAVKRKAAKKKRA